MVRIMRWGLGVVGLAAVGAIAIAAVGIGGSASAQTPSNANGNTTPREQYREALAEELGISVDQLTSAQTAARDKVIDDAVAAGKITQEQADKMKSMQFGPNFGAGHSQRRGERVPDGRGRAEHPGGPAA